MLAEWIWMLARRSATSMGETKEAGGASRPWEMARAFFPPDEMMRVPRMGPVNVQESGWSNGALIPAGEGAMLRGSGSAGPMAMRPGGFGFPRVGPNQCRNCLWFGHFAAVCTLPRAMQNRPPQEGFMFQRPSRIWMFKRVRMCWLIFRSIYSVIKNLRLIWMWYGPKRVQSLIEKYPRGGEKLTESQVASLVDLIQKRLKYEELMMEVSRLDELISKGSPGGASWQGLCQEITSLIKTWVGWSHLEGDVCHLSPPSTGKSSFRKCSRDAFTPQDIFCVFLVHWSYIIKMVVKIIYQKLVVKAHVEHRNGQAYLRWTK